MRGQIRKRNERNEHDEYDEYDDDNRCGNDAFDNTHGIVQKIVEMRFQLCDLGCRNIGLSNEIECLQKEHNRILTIKQQNSIRLMRYNQIRRKLRNVIVASNHIADLRQTPSDKMVWFFKGRSQQKVYIDICIFETTMNMRAKKNSHRRHNNQKLIGKAIERMKASLNIDVHAQYIIFCGQLDPSNEHDDDLITSKMDVSKNGGVLTSDIDDFKRLIKFC